MLATLPFFALMAIVPALAHMEMTYPPPLRSKSNPFVPEPQYDYSMTAPLGAFPCKGYIGNSPMNSVASLPAGSPVQVTIGGTAIHGGGSCQFALSYDLGKTWSTIYSYIGGCLADGTSMSVTIPPEAKSGEALFAWDWFNRVGNREMYMNCAVVTITNGGAGLSNTADFPPPFVANAGKEITECATIEGIDVVFPSPGKNFKYGGGYASTQPKTPAGFTGSNCVPPGQTEGNSGPIGSGGATGGAGGGNGGATDANSNSANPSPTTTLNIDPPPPASTTTATSASTSAGAGGGAGGGTSVVWVTTVVTSVRPVRTGKNGKICRPKKKRSFGPFAPPAPTPAQSKRETEMEGRVVVGENGIEFAPAERNAPGMEGEKESVQRRHQRLVRRRSGSGH